MTSPRAPDELEGFPYAPFYCEENVWHLAQRAQLAAQPRRVVFVSNAARVCPLWSQRAARSPDEPVFWDYHVILLAEGPPGRWQVWDLDTRLGLPVPLDQYLARTFTGAPSRASALAPALAPRFRVIDADAFVQTFCSDREHMRAPGGGYTHPPPSWPLINAGRASNLARFIDMDDPAFVGEVLDLAQLRARFVA